ncbi:MAG: histidine phosphatase family protein [Cytophagales bacterium]
MKLYIIRHAETEYNKKGIIQGSEVDSDINDVGESQANSFYEYYKDINFDKIYVSDLKRTFQTIRRFTQNGLSYEKLKEFNEISWGVNQGKSDDLEDYARLIDTWLAGNLDNKFEEGESPNEMSVRLVKGFNKVLDDDYDTVLLCIHGRALRILLSKIIDNDLTKMDKYVHSNTGLYILENKNGKYEILGSNLRDHLD